MAGLTRRWRGAGTGRARTAAVLLLVLSALHPTIVLLEYAAAAFTEVLAFEGPSADGPFQLYNALRRIEDGQRPGVDFVFFHGVGVPYLHYPVYALFGSTVYASEIARVMVSPLLAVGVTVAFFAAVTGSRRHTVVLSGVAVALTYLLGLGSLLGPANSLLGVRTAVPVLFTALLLWQQFRWRRTGRVVDVAAGAVLALALVFGTEQGIALVAAHALVLLVAGEGPLADRLLALGTRVGVAVAGTVLLTLLAARSISGAVASLRFAFSDVSHDQFWYFGAPPNEFVSRVDELTGDWRFAVPVVAALLALVAVTLLARRGVLPRPTVVALATLLLYGLVSASAYLGIAIFTTAEPAARAVVLTGLAVLHLAHHGRTSRAGAPVASGPALAAPDVRLVLRGSALAVLVLALLIGQPGQAVVAVDAASTYAREGGSLGPGLTELTRSTDELIGSRSCRDGEPSYLWSTYVGLLEAQRDCFHPETDYVIHALGPERRARYLEAFLDEQPAFVQTLRRSASFRYEDWLRHTTWEFYEALLQDYEPAGLTDSSVLWERSPTPGNGLELGPARDGEIGDDGDFSAAVPQGSDLVVLDVEYDVRNPLGAVPVLGQLPRYLVTAEPQLLDTAVPLDPTRSSVRFAVVVPPGTDTVRLRATTASLVPGAGLDVTAVRVQAGRLPDDPRWREALLG